MAICGKTWQKLYPAGRIIQLLAPLVDGKGGGKPAFARGGGKSPEKLDALMEQAPSLLEGMID